MSRTQINIYQTFFALQQQYFYEHQIANSHEENEKNVWDFQTYVSVSVCIRMQVRRWLTWQHKPGVSHMKYSSGQQHGNHPGWTLFTSSGLEFLHQHLLMTITVGADSQSPYMKQRHSWLSNSWTYFPIFLFFPLSLSEQIWVQALKCSDQMMISC